jgi:ABC-2 type transport system permease protein
MVRGGDLPLAVVIPKGFGASFGSFDSAGVPVDLIADSSDPVAPQLVSGLLQGAVMSGMPDVFMGAGVGQFEQHAGPLTPQQRRAVEEWLPELRRSAERGDSAAAGDTLATAADSTVAGMRGLVPVRVVDVLGESKKNPIVAFYAAGIAVMFLLFSASGAGGVLLDEVESGTLERMLGSRVGMTQLLLGKWLFISLLGILQVTIMFTWGALMFGLDLLGHLPGFAVMTLFTAAAAAGFGMVLATAVRTRQQLGGLSTLLILTMSALGGSMFPRFLMSEGMQKLGLVTFNAWALDGYVKVFWREAPLVELWPQVGVLALLTVVFLAVARTLARRWETA